MKQNDDSMLTYYFLLPGMLLLMLALTTHAQSTANPQDDIETAEKEIDQRLRDYEDALRDRDLDALGNLYAIDAEILHSGRSSTVGRENIIKVFEAMIRDSITNSGFETTGLWGNNELLVEQGKGFFAHSTGKWVSHGIYLLVWKKVDGKWLIFRDTWFKQPD